MNSDGESHEKYCTNCGATLPSGAETCPECGSAQPVDGGGGGSGPDGEGLTSWAIGFEPGESGRNVLVGLGYLFFWPVGLALLLYAYPGVAMTRRRWLMVGLVLVGLIVLGAVADPGTTAPSATDGSNGDGGASAAAGDGSVATPSDDRSSSGYAVRVEYGGSWQGAISVTGGGSSQSESISGSGTETIEISGDVDIISANAQKQDDSSRELTIQILRDGDVVAQANTRSGYGVAQVSQSFF